MPQLSNEARSVVEYLIDKLGDEETPFSIYSVRWGDGHNTPPRDVVTPVDSVVGECGTPSCILGWLEYGEVHGKVSRVGRSELEESIQMCRAAGNACLFTPRLDDDPNRVPSYLNAPKWFTKERTLTTLRHLLETGDVDWYALEKGEQQ